MVSTCSLHLDLSGDSDKLSPAGSWEFGDGTPNSPPPIRLMSMPNGGPYRVEPHRHRQRWGQQLRLPGSVQAGLRPWWGRAGRGRAISPTAAWQRRSHRQAPRCAPHGHGITLGDNANSAGSGHRLRQLLRADLGPPRGAGPVPSRGIMDCKVDPTASGLL